MYIYKAYGLLFQSDIKLPGLKIINGRWNVSLRMGNVDPFSSEPLIEGTDFRVTKDGYYLFWENIGRFKVSNGEEIIADIVPGLDEHVITSYIVGPLMAVLLHQRGYLILHASAVNINNEAVAFLGWSGSGKSTIAFSIQKESRLIADDILAINFNKKGIPHVYPGFPYTKIAPSYINRNQLEIKNLGLEDNKAGKCLYLMENNFSDAIVPLKKIYILKEGEITLIGNLSPQMSILELLRHSYLIMLFSDAEKTSNLKQCSNIVEKVEMKVLQYKKIKKNLQKISELILKDYTKIED